jgi:hypothetical protein
MAELLASNSDVNRWLPTDKLEANDSNSAQFQIEAVQLIRGQLASSFTPTVLVGWDTPEHTPQTIRSIAGRLIAAFIYRKAYSEERTQIPPYAQELYDEAIQMLADIRSGNLVVLDPDGNPISTDQLAMSAADFWPNDTTEGPYFTMSDRFA